MKKTLRLIGFLSLFLVNASWADECINALKMDEIELDFDESTALAFLHTINEENWEDFKKEGRFVTEFFGYGMDIGTDGDYHKFKKTRNQVLKEWDFSLDQKRSYSYVSRKLGDNSTKAYIACLENSIVGGGIYILAEDVSDTFIQTNNFKSPFRCAKSKNPHFWN